VISIGHPFRSRSLRLVVGLAVVVAIPVGGLVLVQYRSLRDLQNTSVIVLETLSREVADSLVQSLHVDFERPSYDIERIDHQAVDRGEPAKTLPFLRERGASMPMVDAFYIWASKSGHPDIVLELPNRRDASAAAFEPAGEESERLIARAWELSAPGLNWVTSKIEVEGRPQVIVFHLLFASLSHEKLSSFVAYRVDLDRLRREGLASLLTPYVTSLNRKTNLATLVAEVIDEDGNEAVLSSGNPPLVAIEQRKFPLMFFATNLMREPERCTACVPEWTLRVGYREGTPAAIAYTSTTGHRTLLGMLVVVIGLGFVLAIRVALKEMQLAEAKSHFVASVSHDLKTPLALIQLFAETLELGRVKSADRAKEYYGIINLEAKKLRALIDNVLDFARIESGLCMYRLRPIDVGELVRDVVAGFRPHFAEGAFNVRLHVADTLPPVLADEEAVGLAVGNLLGNAMKYSGDSHEIDVIVEPVAQGTAVRVADRGVGIHWRHQRRIFRKFYRVDGESADAPRGCGLGLAIVDQVMRAHRGRVVVDSEPGKGSAFTLIFPLVPEKALVPGNVLVPEKERDEADSRDRRRAPDAAGAA
jgi:signal transduction histidine kinase